MVLSMPTAGGAGSHIEGATSPASFHGGGDTVESADGLASSGTGQSHRPGALSMSPGDRGIKCALNSLTDSLDSHVTWSVTKATHGQLRA